MCSVLKISPLFLKGKKCASHFCKEPTNEDKQLFKNKNKNMDKSFFRESFRGYRCKSGIVIFAERVP